VRLRLGAARRILSVPIPALSLRALVDQPRVLQVEVPQLLTRSERLEWLRRLLAAWQARADAPDARVARFLTSGDRGELSARQLRRLIQRETGLGPKQLQRTERFHSAFGALTEAPGTRRTAGKGLAAVAAAAGYADQAHFCRDFKLGTSLSPEAWRRRGVAACPFSSSPEELQLATRTHVADRISRNAR
jgi:transcriptional regulator GlxA family with amidase domain